MYNRLLQAFKGYKVIGLYLLSNLFGKGLVFLSFPVFINVLSQQDIGILSVFSSAIVFVNIFLSGAFLFSLDVEYFKHDKENFKQIVSSTIYLPVIFSLMAAAVIWGMFGTLVESFSFQTEFIYLLPVCALNNVFYEASLSLLRNREKPVLYAALNIVKITVELSIAVCLIKFFAWNWQGRVAGIVVAGFICTVFFIWYTWKISLLRIYFAWEKVVSQLKFAIFPMFMQLAVFFVTTSDRFFITRHYSVKETAIYNVASVLASTLFVFFSAIMNYLLPKLYKSQPFKWDNTKHLFVTMIKALLASAVIIVVVSIIVLKWIISKEYAQSIPLFFVLLLSYIIWCMAGYFAFIINFYRSRKVLTQIPFLLIGFAFLNFSLFGTYLTFEVFVYSELIMCLFSLIVYLFFCKRLGFFKSGK